MAEKKTEKNGAPMGPGTSSIKDPEVYEALRREGASEEKAARIANASARDGRDEVAKRARELDIEGRSTMTKDELIEALRDH
ncbi:Rho termination factor N-terminal domain-containing protein [Micrococcus sp. SIMBA_131]